jgi:hypothetical protein
VNHTVYVLYNFRTQFIGLFCTYWYTDICFVQLLMLEGRGACRWWGNVRRSRKRCSPVGEAWGKGGRSAMLGSARSGGVGLGCAGSGVAGSIERRRVK